jgi:hypothetical protein
VERRGTIATVKGQSRAAGRESAVAEEGSIEKTRGEVRSVTMNLWAFSIWIFASVLLSVIVLLSVVGRQKEE